MAVPLFIPPTAYVTGETLSTDFPTPSGYDSSYNGGDDAFVSKLSHDGSTLIYSTYLGGGNYDYGWGIAVDSSENAYVTGWTFSTDFPTPSGYDSSYNGFDDAFVSKLSHDGSTLIYSTYLGGGYNDRGLGIAVDSSENAYVTGYTYSSDFPTSSAYDSSLGGDEDAFVSKLSHDGSSLIYSTYLGGGNDDRGYGIAVDSSGNAYVTGWTFSTDFPTPSGYDSSYNGGYDDAFVSKLSSDGSTLIYSTYRWILRETPMSQEIQVPVIFPHLQLMIQAWGAPMMPL